MLRKADKIQPRMARAYEKAVGKMQDRVKINKLADALETGNVGMVMGLLDEWKVFDDPLVPVAKIAKDAFLEGGKIGARQINHEFERMFRKTARGRG